MNGNGTGSMLLPDQYVASPERKADGGGDLPGVAVQTEESPHAAYSREVSIQAIPSALLLLALRDCLTCKAMFVLDSAAIAAPSEMPGRRDLHLVPAGPISVRAAHR